MLNFGGVSEAEKIEAAIDMLKQYVEEDKIQPFLSILEKLKDEPGNELLQTQLYDAFQNLGIYQGSVLTYAPSIYHLIVDDPFTD
jgi:hypothetical protein